MTVLKNGKAAYKVIAAHRPQVMYGDTDSSSNGVGFDVTVDDTATIMRKHELAQVH